MAGPEAGGGLCWRAYAEAGRALAPCWRWNIKKAPVRGLSAGGWCISEFWALGRLCGKAEKLIRVGVRVLMKKSAVGILHEFVGVRVNL